MKRIFLFVVFFCICTNLYARNVNTTVTLPNGDTAMGYCSMSSCRVDGIDYPRTGDSFTEYVLGPPISSSPPPSEPTAANSTTTHTPTEAPLIPINSTEIPPSSTVTNVTGGNAVQYNAPTRVETENGTTTAYYKNSDGTYIAAPATVETENGITTTYIKQPDGTYTTIAGDATQSNTTAATNKTSTTSDKNNILGLEKEDLRSGNVDMNTIPKVIVSIIQTLLAIAGTVAIFSLIYHAVQMQINSGITGDSSGVDKAKKGMTGALVGFVIAIAAWFLVTRAVDLLTAVS